MAGFNVGDIVFDGVDLNNSLQWTDRYSYNGVAQTTERTLGGGLILFTQGLHAGRPITLEATEETGWFTFGMVNDMMERAADPDAVYVLEYWGEEYTVRFDHSQAPAAAFQPLQPKDPNEMDNDTDYFTGSMKLLTV